jgi:hypothetical protein
MNPISTAPGPGSDVEKVTGAAPASLADFAPRTTAAWAVDEMR